MELQIFNKKWYGRLMTIEKRKGVDYLDVCLLSSAKQNLMHVYYLAL